MRKYEDLPQWVQIKVNEKLDRLNKFKHMTTDKERQYEFLTFLQKLPITEKQVFDVYTNTEIIEKEETK